MSFAVFSAAFASAFLHAIWNMLAKTRGASPDTFGGIVLATASICMVLVPLTGMPAVESFPWIAAASVCNVAYVQLVTDAYKTCDFNVVYAVIRATIPPVMFAMGWLFLTETGRLSAFAGLILVAASLLLFGAQRGRDPNFPRRGLLLSIMAGLILAVALLLDVKGVRAGGMGVMPLVRYSIASSLATAAGLLLVSAFRRKRLFLGLSSNPAKCYLGAFLLLGSYLFGMWAYAEGPVGLVAPLRESGILFSSFLAVLVLGERVTRIQWAALALAIFGVVMIQAG